MLRRRQRGQSVIEFGLIAIVFVTVLFGIADMGLLLNGWISVSSAAREGARHAAVGEHVADTITATRNFSPPPGVRPSDLKVLVIYGNCAVSCTVFCGPGATSPTGTCDTHPQTSSPPITGPSDPLPDTPTTVVVTADTFEVITPLVRPFFGCGPSVPHCNVPIRSSTTMRFEGSQ